MTLPYYEGGAIFWNGVLGAGAISEIPMMSSYKRKAAAVVKTELAAFLNAAASTNRTARLRAQDCVPGSGKLVPAAVPSITATDGTIIPEYNSVAYRNWFQDYHTGLKNDARALQPALPIFMDFGWGRYNEGNGAGAVAPTAATIKTLLTILYGIYGMDRVICCTDGIGVPIHHALGGTRYFRDSLGDIENPSHFDKPWIATATSAIMNAATTKVYTEPIRKGALSYFSTTRALEQFNAHPQIIAVANGNGDFNQRTAAERTTYGQILTAANARAVLIGDNPPPTPPTTGDLTALRAELADTKLRLAQCEIECTAATTRAANLTAAAHTIITANTTMQAAYAKLAATMQTTYAELVALLAVPS